MSRKLWRHLRRRGLWFAHLLDDRQPSRRTTNTILDADGNAHVFTAPDRSKGG
jgi:hypothetical protein